jgi:hypothetical protein
MHPAGFEPTTLVFERAKTVHALDLAASDRFLVIRRNKQMDSCDKRTH